MDFRVDVTGTAAGALSGAEAAGLRRCFDDRGGRVVGCDEPHTIEYFATSNSGIAAQSECESVAVLYLGISPQGRSSELTVKRIAANPAHGDNARCVIQVVGSQRLAVSVRGIENRQLDWVD